MWSLQDTAASALALGLLAAPAAAQTVDATGQPIIIPSQSSVFNQNSMNLPSAPVVSGQDVVRGADGTTCQSAIASGGPYVDVGVLQSQDFYARDSAALYGRVVFPLGKRSRRVDCTRLYRLEIERMRMELELLRMGMSFGDSLAMEEPTEMAALNLPPEDQVGQGVTVPTHNDAQPMTVQPSVGMAANVRPSEPEPEVEAVEPTSPPATPPVSAHGVRYVQAGAFATEQAAALHLSSFRRWTVGRATAIVPVRRSGRTLYRSLIGPMSPANARSLCAALPTDCFVVTR